MTHLILLTNPISHLKKLYLTLIILSLSLLALAQENYLLGYVITNSSDTTRGYIDYRNWKVNPEYISFKQTADGLVTIYPPSDIAAFSVGHEFYESATVDIETSPQKVNELTYESAFKIEKQTAFLQCLIKGEKSLYYLLNKVGNENFYVKKENKYELLLYKKYGRTENYTRKVYEYMKYPGQLKLYLIDCPSIQQKISIKRYLKGDLTKLFEQYYACTNKKYDFNKKSDKIRTEIGLLSGATVSTLDFSGSHYPHLTQADISSSVDYTGGLYFDFVLPRNQGKWIIATELSYTNHYFNFQYEDYRASNTTIKTSYMKVNIMAKFRYAINKVNVFANVGISNGFMIDNINEVVFSASSGSPHTPTTQPAIGNLKKYGQGIMGGAGASFKRFGLQFRYEWSNGLSKALNVTVDRCYFLASYRLSK